MILLDDPASCGGFVMRTNASSPQCFVFCSGSGGEGDDPAPCGGAVARPDDGRGRGAVGATQSVCRHAGRPGQSGHRQLLPA